MKMSKGTYISSNVPYGYRLVDTLPQIYEQEAEVVRRIFKEYIGGRGCKAIATGLIADGIPRKDGEQNWKTYTIASMIRNERYIGDMLMQKSFNADDIPYTKTLNKGQLPQYYIKNSHEPIIDRLEWQLANALLKVRSSKISKSAPREYILSKKIKCSECGTTYRRKVSAEKVYWVCREYDNDKKCSGSRLTENDIYSAFIKVYNLLKANKDELLYPMLYSLEKLQDLKKKSNIELNAINHKIAELHRQNQVLSGLMKDGVLDSAIFISKSNDLNRSMMSLKREKQVLLDEQEQHTMLDMTELIIDTIEQGPAKLYEMDEEIFDDLVEYISAEGKKIAFILLNKLKLEVSI